MIESYQMRPFPPKYLWLAVGVIILIFVARTYTLSFLTRRPSPTPIPTPTPDIHQKKAISHPSGKTAQIVNGPGVELAYETGRSYPQQILILWQPDQPPRSILSISPENAHVYETISDVIFSPHGKFLQVLVTGWEWSSKYIFDLEKGTDILSPLGNNLYISSFDDIRWGPEDKYLVIRSYHEDFGGSGIDGVFASQYGYPDRLKLIFGLAPTHPSPSRFSQVEDFTVADDIIEFSGSTISQNHEPPYEREVLDKKSYRYDIRHSRFF